MRGAPVQRLARFDPSDVERPRRGLEHELIHVAERPILAGLIAANDRMSRRVEVLRRMLAGRAVTAPDVATLETEAQVDPAHPGRETFLTTLGSPRSVREDVVEVCAVGHDVTFGCVASLDQPARPFSSSGAALAGATSDRAVVLQNRQPHASRRSGATPRRNIMDSPAVHAPDFPDTLDWIHTGGRRLTLADFRGKLLLLDFWTYG